MWLFRKDPHVKPEGPLAFRVRVRTKSGEVVELRLSKSAEISPTEEGYYVRKELVAPIVAALDDISGGPNALRGAS